MKNMILICIAVILSGCASYPPVWQQELNNLIRAYRPHQVPITSQFAQVVRPDHNNEFCPITGK